jgi:hypothetical protein
LPPAVGQLFTTFPDKFRIQLPLIGPARVTPNFRIADKPGADRIRQRFRFPALALPDETTKYPMIPFSRLENAGLHCPPYIWLD